MARTNKRVTVKWVSTPMSGGITKSVWLPDAEYSHPPEEGSLLPIEGWVHTLHQKGREAKISQETRINSESMRTCSPNEKGGAVAQPLRCHLVHWVEQASKLKLPP